MMKRVFKISFVLFLTVFACIPGTAQPQDIRITGRVTDAGDHSPLAGATVYLSNTTIGATTTEKGTFVLKNIPPGNYDLVASYLGYKTFSVAVNGQDTGREISISLRRDVGKLKEVTVRAKRRKDKNRKNYFELFRNYFLGTDVNADRCKILNPDVLYYGYDEQSRAFTVSAAEPLVIVNEALGYRIYYDLQSFSFSFNDHHIVYFGYPKFEALTTTDPRQQMTWENNRIVTYRQSGRYFMLMLKERQLADKGFEVNKLIRVNKDSLPPLPVYSSREIEKMLHGNEPVPVIEEPQDTMYPNQEPYDSILRSKPDSNYVKLKFNYSLRILIPEVKDTIRGMKPGLNVVTMYEGGDRQSARVTMTTHRSRPPGPSVSIITMVRPETYIDPNGVLTDPLAVSVEGAWARMQVADLLPFNYRPPE